MICQGLWVKIGELGIYTYSSTSKNIINAEWFYKRHRNLSFLSGWNAVTLYNSGGGSTMNPTLPSYWYLYDYFYVFVRSNRRTLGYYGYIFHGGNIVSALEVALIGKAGGGTMNGSSSDNGAVGKWWINDNALNGNTPFGCYCMKGTSQFLIVGFEKT